MRARLLAALVVTALAAVVLTSSAALSAATTITVTSATSNGTTICDVGATEGSSGFNIADLTDLGINTYRIWGGMSRWEPTDDDGVFGSPSIAQIKANINLIPWSYWDNEMTNPPNGSDYYWSDQTNGAKVTAAQIFSALKAAGIRPVVTLRNVDNNQQPAWASQLNPPSTVAGQNEWFEHVVATVYELDVRNNWGVDDWQVHNEPNKSGQGWGGTETDYEDFIRQTSNAIKWVYATYLPGRTPHIYAPVTSTGSNWPDLVMRDVGPTYFDSVDIHDYNSNEVGAVEQARNWMNADGYAGAPLWISEAGTWHQGMYGQIGNAINLLAANIVRLSAPGIDHADGWDVFSLYDWGTYNSGIIAGTPAATKLNGYYAMRNVIRGTQGCKPTYPTTGATVPVVVAKDATGTYVTVVNTGTTGTFTFDLSKLITSGTGTEWLFDSSHPDVVAGSPTLSAGKVTITLGGNSSAVLKF